jgi:hypothetical protein
VLALHLRLRDPRYSSRAVRVHLSERRFIRSRHRLIVYGSVAKRSDDRVNSPLRGIPQRVVSLRL